MAPNGWLLVGLAGVLAALSTGSIASGSQTQLEEPPLKSQLSAPYAPSTARYINYSGMDSSRPASVLASASRSMAAKPHHSALHPGGKRGLSSLPSSARSRRRSKKSNYGRSIVPLQAPAATNGGKQVRRKRHASAASCNCTEGQRKPNGGSDGDLFGGDADTMGQAGGQAESAELAELADIEAQVGAEATADQAEAMDNVTGQQEPAMESSSEEELPRPEAQVSSAEVSTAANAASGAASSERGQTPQLGEFLNNGLQSFGMMMPTQVVQRPAVSGAGGAHSPANVQQAGNGLMDMGKLMGGLFNGGAAGGSGAPLQQKPPVLAPGGFDMNGAMSGLMGAFGGAQQGGSGPMANQGGQLDLGNLMRANQQTGGSSDPLTPAGFDVAGAVSSLLKGASAQASSAASSGPAHSSAASASSASAATTPMDQANSSGDGDGAGSNTPRVEPTEHSKEASLGGGINMSDPASTQVGGDKANQNSQQASLVSGGAKPDVADTVHDPLLTNSQTTPSSSSAPITQTVAATQREPSAETSATTRTASGQVESSPPSSSPESSASSDAASTTTTNTQALVTKSHEAPINTKPVSGQNLKVPNDTGAAAAASSSSSGLDSASASPVLDSTLAAPVISDSASTSAVSTSAAVSAVGPEASLAKPAASADLLDGVSGANNSKPDPDTAAQTGLNSLAGKLLGTVSGPEQVNVSSRGSSPLDQALNAGKQLFEGALHPKGPQVGEVSVKAEPVVKDNNKDENSLPEMVHDAKNLGSSLVKGQGEGTNVASVQSAEKDKDLEVVSLPSPAEPEIKPEPELKVVDDVKVVASDAIRSHDVESKVTKDIEEKVEDLKVGILGKDSLFGLKQPIKAAEIKEHVQEMKEHDHKVVKEVEVEEEVKEVVEETVKKVKKPLRKSRPKKPHPKPQQHKPTPHYPQKQQQIYNGYKQLAKLANTKGLYESPKLKELPDRCQFKLLDLRKTIDEILLMTEQYSQRILLDTKVSYKTREILSKKLKKIRSAAEEARMATHLAQLKLLNDSVRVAGVELLRIANHPVTLRLAPTWRPFTRDVRLAYLNYKKACKGVFY